jgi:hypothetical protein
MQPQSSLSKAKILCALSGGLDIFVPIGVIGGFSSLFQEG